MKSHFGFLILDFGLQRRENGKTPAAGASLALQSGIKNPKWD